MITEPRNRRHTGHCTICEQSLPVHNAFWDMEKPYCANCIMEGIEINRLINRPEITENIFRANFALASGIVDFLLQILFTPFRF
ncbi:MAG: hypothetical protein ACOC2L_02350 [Candidatus Sumerlaeota bacterium]